MKAVQFWINLLGVLYKYGVGAIGDQILAHVWPNLVMVQRLEQVKKERNGLYFMAPEKISEVKWIACC